MSAIVSAVIATTLIVTGSQPAPVTSSTPPPVWLHGQFQQGPTKVVPYPAGFVPGLEGNVPLGQSLPVGVANTEAMQDATPGPVVEVGTSQGAMVLDQVMADDAKAGVPASKVSFVVVDDPQRGSGILTFLKHVPIPGMNYTPKAVPETPYNVTVVVKQYDLLADAPNNPKSPGFMLAVVNAGFGAALYHQSSVTSDLSKVPQSNITTSVNSVGGKTTTYLVPTRTLPVVTALEKAGLPKQLGDPLNSFFKPIIDSAYSRPGSSKPTAQAKPVAAVKPAAKGK